MSRDDRKTFLCHNLGIALHRSRLTAAWRWIATFFIRHHHWTAAEAGKSIGIVIALAGSLGIVWGGWLADRLAARGHADAYLRVAMLAVVAAVPAGIPFLLVSDPHLAIILSGSGALSHGNSHWRSSSSPDASYTQPDARPGECSLSVYDQSDRARRWSRRRWPWSPTMCSATTIWWDHPFYWLRRPPTSFPR